MTAGFTETMPKIFVIFGMPRTGTTYLYRALSRHPQIFVPYRKESHYFSVNYVKGQQWFASLYEGIPEGKLGADINPMYFLDPMAIDRILAYDRDVKVILGVRDPVDFAISLYRNMVTHGLDVPSIVHMVQDFDWPLTPHTSLRFSLGDNFISRRINELRDRFGENVMLYDFRRFDVSPLPVMQAMERFLGLDPFFSEANHEAVRINASGRRNPLGLNSLIANQRVLDMLYAITPRVLVRQARWAFERLSARGDRSAADISNADTGVREDERAWLESFFAEDTAFYRALFEESPFILPAGTAMPVPHS